MAPPIVVTVAGGKGGVGKSLVAANLAVQVAGLGMRTLLVDADLGAPGQHTLFGVDRLGPSLAAFMDGRARTLDEITIPSGVSGLGLVPGVGGVPGAANPAHARKLRLARAISSVEADMVIVDLGAGTSHNVVDLFLLGHARLIVVAPQLTSVQSAYCFAKTAVLRAIRALATCPREVDAIEAAFEARALAKVTDGIAALSVVEPALAGRVRRVLRRFDATLIGNPLETPSSAGVIHALCRMSREFLGLCLEVGALIPRSAALHASVDRRRPLCAEPSRDPVVATAFETLAERLVVVDPVATLRARDASPTSDLPPREERDDGERAFVTELGALQRREVRTAADVAVVLRTDELCHAARAIDLSEHGALIVSDLRLQRGDRLRLSATPDGHGVVVVVRHVMRDRCGVEAEDPDVSLVRVLRPPAARPAMEGPPSWPA